MPKSWWGWVKASLHFIYDQPDAESVHAQFERVVDALAENPPVTEHLDGAEGVTNELTLLALTA